MPQLDFTAGTLTLTGDLPAEGLPPEVAKFFLPDARTGTLRARACDYGPIVLGMRLHKVPFEDRARDFAPLSLTLREELTPRPHQKRALAAWDKALWKGVAALPTGSGKTILAVMAIYRLQRPALVLVPTIDLMIQWAGVLERFFGRPVGMLGGGEHRVEPLTVSTYESAVLNVEFIGNRFALLIADECHHLPGPETRLAGAMCIAPYRLGLSATPELPDDREAVLTDLMGEVVCKVDISDLEGSILSPYEVRRLHIDLDPDEAAAYRQNRTIYTAFLRANGITFQDPAAWGRFLGLAARSPRGRGAFRAFLEQRRIARSGRAKLRRLWEILRAHPGERVLIFTADNATAYTIGRDFLLPVLTCRTKAAERKELLDRFRAGEYPVLVTSRVLNEGVDVPSAAVGVILSGSGSIREHVQRLGRILRPAAGKKQAVLYELVSADTSEEGVSDRRREHQAYRRRKRYAFS